jgi:hypothetical protein
MRARAVSACVPGQFLRVCPGSFCVRARAVSACVPGQFLHACFFSLLCVVEQMGYPAWLLLSGTEHAITETEDIDVVKAVYNKYKKCKKQDAFRASIDALFYVNTYKARNPSTYFADMKRIKEQFDKVVRAAFRACSFPCVQLSAAFRACSFPCLSVSARTVEMGALVQTAKKTVTSTAAPAAPSAIPEYAPESSSTFTFAHVMPSKIGFKGEPQAGGIVRPPSKRAHDPKGFVGSHAQKKYLKLCSCLSIIHEAFWTLHLLLATQIVCASQTHTSKLRSMCFWRTHKQCLCLRCWAGPLCQKT